MTDVEAGKVPEDDEKVQFTTTEAVPDGEEDTFIADLKKAFAWVLLRPRAFHQFLKEKSYGDITMALSPVFAVGFVIIWTSFVMSDKGKGTGAPIYVPPTTNVYPSHSPSPAPPTPASGDDDSSDGATIAGAVIIALYIIFLIGYDCILSFIRSVQSGNVHSGPTEVVVNQGSIVWRFLTGNRSNASGRWLMPKSSGGRSDDPVDASATEAENNDDDGAAAEEERLKKEKEEREAAEKKKAEEEAAAKKKAEEEAAAKKKAEEEAAKAAEAAALPDWCEPNKDVISKLRDEFKAIEEKEKAEGDDGLEKIDFKKLMTRFEIKPDVIVTNMLFADKSVDWEEFIQVMGEKEEEKQLLLSAKMPTD